MRYLHPSFSTPNDLMKDEFQLGDRVLVGGSKKGIVRFIGTTGFAKGTWAGVELFKPMGENNGSLYGIR